MGKMALVTDDDLARARTDPAFRHRLLADNLRMLLDEISRMRGTRNDAAADKKVREGVALAVELSQLLQRLEGSGRPRAA